MSVSKNYLYNVLLIISNTIFPIITFPYISRILMPEYLGKVYFVQGVVAYFLIISVLGAPNYGIKELSRAKGIGDWVEFKKIFTELFIMTILSSIGSLILLLITVQFYGKFYQEKLIFYIFAIQVLFECFHINHFFVVMENHKRRLIRSFTIRVLSLGFLFYFIKTPSDYYLYALLLVVPEVLARIIDVISVRKYFYFKDLNFKRHTSNMFIIFLYIFTIGIYGSIDTTMLGIMINDTEVGLYTAAVKMYKMVLPVILTLGTVLSPRIIGAIKRKEKQNIYKNIDVFIDYCFIVGVPATLLMMILAREFTLLFSGPDFKGAIETMIIMSPCLGFLALGTFVGGQVMLPNDLEKDILLISIFGVFLNIGLNYFLIPIYLRNGAALATLITEVIVALIKIGKMKKLYCDYKIMTKDRVLTIIVGIIIACGIYLKINSIRELGNLISLIAVPIIYGVIYFLILILLKNMRVLSWIDFIKKRLH
ncbi:flippase [Cetobacterium somerae]|uniref:flippase n=1 Tax=Cetobacterium sp. NK01 TaxID=2993530 RepID=UPI002115E702|nr:flippase [Cetobacterium sp. NK01]MCQ8211876.1 flippase [Cetobacterium sp. NK01]